MTTMEAKEFIKKSKEKNDIWDEQQVIDVFGNMSLNDALSVRFKELEMFNENIVKAKLAVQSI
ncbi:hypothetical protein [Faecalibacillus intestinalis]|uniref:hypothetical protein n=1 Tax=Faecalibacillus intestinalis TaxID=1982626 RepID=UPI0022E272B6|nr:hypothetical protein [Faecalibacillus intestinalis]